MTLEAEGDDRDVVRVISRELAEAADREEKVFEGVARLRLERSSLAHLRAAEPRAGVRRLPVGGRLRAWAGDEARLASGEEQERSVVCSRQRDAPLYVREHRAKLPVLKGLEEPGGLVGERALVTASGCVHGVPSHNDQVARAPPLWRGIRKRCRERHEALGWRRNGGDAA